MPNEDKITEETLWAVHVLGPDDLVPVKDRAEGDRLAAEINDMARQWRERPDASPLDPRISAELVPWDGSAEQHAASLAELAADGGYTP